MRQTPKLADAHAGMWEELNTDTTDTETNEKHNEIFSLFFDVRDSFGIPPKISFVCVDANGGTTSLKGTKCYMTLVYNSIMKNNPFAHGRI